MIKFQIDNIKDFDVDHIFDCGQCFRWYREEDGSYSGIAKGKFVNISYNEGLLTIENATKEDFENLWHHYLDMGTDYAKIKQKLKRNDKKMREIISKGEGIRILNQELWETIISFIISANNNIPRIKSSIESLCRHFGEPLGVFRGREGFSFPRPEVLASLSVEDLAVCKLGYRDKYIINTAKKYLQDREGFERLSHKDIEGQEAFKKLRELSGVGPKVANCILLFSLEKRDSFPIDVWMKRVMNAVYNIDEDDLKSMEIYAREHFGKLSGIAQQYLFYYMRNKSND